jgi:hypothetical protein
MEAQRLHTGAGIGRDAGQRVVQRAAVAHGLHGIGRQVEQPGERWGRAGHAGSLSPAIG